MIYTRFGSEIKILKDTGEGWLLCERLEDHATREFHISDLRADGGLDEIQDAINKTKDKGE